MKKYQACPVCYSPSTRAEEVEWSRIDCLRCGQYRINLGRSALPFRWNSDQEFAQVSGWVREHQKELLRQDVLETLLSRKPPTVGEKAEKVLRGLASEWSAPGAPITLVLQGIEKYSEVVRELENPYNEDEKLAEIQLPYYLMGGSYSRNTAELAYLLDHYLVQEKGYLSKEILDYKISPKGWAHLDEAAVSTDSTQVFVAMWFSDETSKLWTQGIYPGIEAAGYVPFRIDKHDHNNRIDDEIIAAIKRSKFLVADFTGQRGGVYFEAGFALGLGQQVIWLCRQDALSEVHFDTRQYNHITWEMDKLSELARALTLRIEATIGRGPQRD